MGDLPGRPRTLLPALALAAAASSAAALQVPQPQTQREATGCGERASLSVTVRDDSGLLPMPSATVVLRWTDAVRRPVREAADGEGRLFLCVPRDADAATLWAEFGDASSEEVRVVLVPGYAHEVELRLLFGDLKTGRLIGRVSDAGTQNPVAAAAISVADRPEVVESNRRGYFVLSGLPVGEHELSVRHLGYAPFTHVVRVTQGSTTEVRVGLSPDPVELAPLVATATRPRRLELKGFYERKYWGELIGGSTFLTAEDIERRTPLRITHMIAEAPGIKLGNCTVRGHGCKLYSTRSGVGINAGGCEMSVYLDGLPVLEGSSRFRTSASTRTYSSGGSENAGLSINDFVMPNEIAGVEIYRGLASLPAEFGGHTNRCGVVAVWTR